MWEIGNAGDRRMELLDRMMTQLFGNFRPREVRIFLPLGYLLLGIFGLMSQEVVVAWESNDEPDLLGYKVYYGYASRRYETCIDVRLVTEYTLTTLPESGTFYFAVTAYDVAGNESDYSQEVSISLNVPSDGYFSLMPNYPNPFNPETGIPYFLPKRLSITLAIYDLLGREVKLLEQGVKEAGRYEARWDGTDRIGMPVANGIYFCRLLVGNLCQTKKLILVR